VSIGYGAFASCTALSEVYFLGNVPNIGLFVFGTENVTIYYLPCSTGWSSSFAGLPTVATTAPALLSFTTNNGTITVTGYSGSCGTVIIPTNINGYTVTTIGDGAFYGNTVVVNVTIPVGVTSIGYLAFGADAWAPIPSLSRITLPSSLTTIGEGAFAGCRNLGSVSIPGSVKNFGTDAFEDCLALTDVRIAEGVPYIGHYAFEYCSSLTNVAIPSSVRNIGLGAFAYCSALTEIVIPKGVNTIEQWAFAFCGLTTVSISETVSNIGPLAFADNSSLTAANFRGNAPAVGLLIFMDDNNVTVYYLPNTTGWSSPFGGDPYDGVPATIWRPVIKTGDRLFGTANGQFSFNIKWAEGMTAVVEACTNPANPVWTPLATNILSGDLSYFNDPEWTNFPSRYYRIRWP
jgi:hypothetical protein